MNEAYDPLAGDEFQRSDQWHRDKSILPGDPALDVVRLENIKKSFGQQRVLDGLNLSVQQGEVFGFLGRNGAGKSTAIRILMGITQCDSGHVSVFGRAMRSDMVRLRRRIGYVAQEQNMYPWMTPRVMARFVKGFFPRWDNDRYVELLRQFELPAKRRIGTFSGGMKAKLSLTLALATRPDLLILDEPTAGMDPVARREFLDLVSEQVRLEGVSTLFSTHLIDEIEAAADRIAIVDSGRTLYEGQLTPLRNSIASWSIDAGEYLPGSMPGDFARDRLRVLSQVERKGRVILTLQFSEETLATREIVLNDGWRHEPMSLEDVFISVVSDS